MASKNRRRGKAPTRTQVRNDLRKLKSSGLYKGDLRRRPTRYAVGQVKKFKDVLTGKAKVVETPSRKIATQYKSSFKTKGNKVIVPKRAGDRIRYSKKTGDIITRRKAYGKNLKITHPKRLRSIGDLDKLPQGPNITYRLPVGLNGSMETMTFGEVKKFYNEYKKRGKNFTDFMRVYLEIVEDEDYEEYENYENEEYDEDGEE